MNTNLLNDLNRTLPPQNPLFRPFFYVGLWTVKLLGIPFLASDKALAWLGIFEVIGIISLISYFILLTSNLYQKPQAWIIPQSVYSNISKNQAITRGSKNGVIELNEFTKIATSDALPKPEAVMIGNTVYLSTGELGEVSAKIPFGAYSLSVVPIPGVDFTNVPKDIEIKRAVHELNLGLSKGKGRVLLSKDPLKGIIPTLFEKKSKAAPDSGTLVLKLFNDKNADSKKDFTEPQLRWAGVTLVLEKL